MCYADDTTPITENAKDLKMPENQGDQWEKWEGGIKQKKTKLRTTGRATSLRIRIGDTKVMDSFWFSRSIINRKGCNS